MKIALIHTLALREAQKKTSGKHLTDVISRGTSRKNLTIIDFLESIGESLTSMEDVEKYGDRKLIELCAEWSQAAQEEKSTHIARQPCSRKQKSFRMTLNTQCAKKEVEAISKLAEAKSSTKKRFRGMKCSDDDILELNIEIDLIENSLNLLEQELRNAVSVI